MEKLQKKVEKTKRMLTQVSVVLVIGTGLML